MIFDLNGIAVSVFRKRVKNINITVKNAKVSVSVPPRATDGEIERFLRLKEPWIRRAVAVQTERAEAENRGDEFTLLGRTYRIVRCDGERSPTFDEGTATIFCAGDAGELSEYGVERLRSLLNAKIAYWERATGLTAKVYKLRKMKSRWGSCNRVSGKITFSTGLYKCPEDCIDYVIVHELTHLAVSGHGRDFKETLKKFMPDYRAREIVLKRYSP